ncbi:aldehyde dehydrogenase domain-containing protein [Thelephora terrestris]|uniref:Aldehyde dehydrogenase domain-containing protein n=1 Tax=Thelephora terrestris TaxID=56493 RepID=A0A9P6L4U1_9AGAM|nr:aldehyde dehydrogenase domain-containing protein [Thelephora terrestris]
MSQIVKIKIAATGRTIELPTGLFINNEFVPSVDSQETLSAINPATEEEICKVVAASEKDIDLAVKAARAAFKNTWGKNVTGFERSRLLYKLADLIERDQQELAELETLNNGKPVRIARDFDIGDTVQCLRYYAGWADKILGETIEVDNKTKLAFTRADPIGVCGQIVPWNYPIMIWAWKVAPALAVGCTVVMKPSELTPLTALKLSQLVKEAGFPPGVVNTVPSLGHVGGAALAAHMDVDLVAFTGSTVTGKKIMEAAARSNLKKVLLELGGKSPNIIFESADLEQAATWAVLGTLSNSGEDCTAGSRVYVQESVYDKFIDLLIEKVKSTPVGDGFDDAVTNGPVISKTHFDRVWGHIESGKREGAKILVGGERRVGSGYFIDPTVFVDVKQDMKIVNEEIFGPVLAVGRFSTEEEAIELANNTRYGLGAGLHSRDANQAMRVSLALDAGTVWVNQYDILHNNVPFGGKKQSGIGRELGKQGLDEYISVKAIHWNFGEKASWPV